MFKKPPQSHPPYSKIGIWQTALTIVWLIFRLLLFVILMLPGFVPPFLSYLLSKHIKKSIIYDPLSRQQLDVYLPIRSNRRRLSTSSSIDSSEEDRKAPVVIFVSGGAWIIGYKLWGFIMGQLFQQFGVIFIAPDYRNFPFATVGDMVDDVSKAVQWTFDNIADLSGDPSNVTLMGQSAGAHISALALLEQASKGALQTGELTTRSWQVDDLARWVGISGPYDLIELLPELTQRGLPKSVIFEVMQHDLDRFSPTRRMRDLNIADALNVVSKLPLIYLFHGKADKTVSWKQSEAFAEALQTGGVEVSRVHTKFYNGKSHTDPILEDPCEGDGDELMSDLLKLVSPSSSESSGKYWCLQPRLLLRWARVCNPF